MRGHRRFRGLSESSGAGEGGVYGEPQISQMSADLLDSEERPSVFICKNPTGRSNRRCTPKYCSVLLSEDYESTEPRQERGAMAIGMIDQLIIAGIAGRGSLDLIYLRARAAV